MSFLVRNRLLKFHPLTARVGAVLLALVTGADLKFPATNAQGSTTIDNGVPYRTSRLCDVNVHFCRPNILTEERYTLAWLHKSPAFRLSIGGSGRLISISH